MKNAKKEYNRAGYSVGIVFFLVYHTAKRKGSMHMELMYTSTRNASEKVTASQAILKGLSDYIEIVGSNRDRRYKKK